MNVKGCGQGDKDRPFSDLPMVLNMVRRELTYPKELDLLSGRKREHTLSDCPAEPLLLA
jgi:hypothetical protein